jgi:hypothetical protein
MLLLINICNMICNLGKFKQILRYSYGHGISSVILLSIRKNLCKIMYSFSKRMRVGHDFLTHFTQYSKFDNINCHELSAIK